MEQAAVRRMMAHLRPTLPILSNQLMIKKVYVNHLLAKEDLTIHVNHLLVK